MGKTTISWTDFSFNPWHGCAKVSPACDNCYAERDSKRYRPHLDLWGVDADRLTFGDKHWDEPLKWERKAERLGVRYRVFCASMADVFDKNAPPGARARLWQLIGNTPHLDWLLLTKRIGNAEKMLPPDWVLDGRPPGNVWLGISVVTQEEADRDIPKLLTIPARIRWISAEPLLEKIDLRRFLWKIETIQPMNKEFLDWVITGGESGPKARPSDPDWYRILRDQCVAAGVPFHFKQWGEWAPWEFDSWEPGSVSQSIQIEHADKEPTTMYRVGKALAGRQLDARTWDEFPL